MCENCPILSKTIRKDKIMEFVAQVTVDLEKEVHTIITTFGSNETIHAKIWELCKKTQDEANKQSLIQIRNLTPDEMAFLNEELNQVLDQLMEKSRNLPTPRTSFLVIRSLFLDFLRRRSFFQ